MKFYDSLSRLSCSSIATFPAREMPGAKYSHPYGCSGVSWWLLQLQQAAPPLLAIRHFCAPSHLLQRLASVDDYVPRLLPRVICLRIHRSRDGRCTEMCPVAQLCPLITTTIVAFTISSFSFFTLSMGLANCHSQPYIYAVSINMLCYICNQHNQIIPARLPAGLRQTFPSQSSRRPHQVYLLEQSVAVQQEMQTGLARCTPAVRIPGPHLPNFLNSCSLCASDIFATITQSAKCQIFAQFGFQCLSITATWSPAQKRFERKCSCSHYKASATAFARFQENRGIGSPGAHN